MATSAKATNEVEKSRRQLDDIERRLRAAEVRCATARDALPVVEEAAAAALVSGTAMPDIAAVKQALAAAEAEVALLGKAREHARAQVRAAMAAAAEARQLEVEPRYREKLAELRELVARGVEVAAEVSRLRSEMPMPTGPWTFSPLMHERAKPWLERVAAYLEPPVVEPSPGPRAAPGHILVRVARPRLGQPLANYSVGELISLRRDEVPRLAWRGAVEVLEVAEVSEAAEVAEAAEVGA